MWAASSSASRSWRRAATAAVCGRERVACFASAAATDGASKAKVTAVSRVRGTRDLLADDAAQHQQVLHVLQQTVGCYGFRPIQTPLLEYTDLFSRSLGDGSDIVMKEMYTFKDNSSKSVTLRPEGTAGIIRALLSNNLMFSLPQKVTYAGSMFRYERPQRGRYREFQQFGVEFVGSSGPSVDVEVIAMAADALQALGIRHKAMLELNTLGDAESRGRYRVALEEFFSQYKHELSPDSINRLERGSVLRILDSKSEVDQKFVAEAPRLDAYLSNDAAQRFDAVLSGLDALGIKYRHNSRLVRGLDYYSHTVFEFVENLSANVDDEHDGEPGSGGIAVLAGGCYDNLSETLGGPPVSCIGWAAGVDRLHLLRDIAVEPPTTIAVVPVLVGDDQDAVLHESMQVAHTLRQRGLSVHFCHGRGNLKKQMKAAEKFGCTYAVILGGDEVKNKYVKVKNLEKRQEETVSLNELRGFEFAPQAAN
uniref:histidine--tRNA ligase n=1 Tax=Globisporangium ultimum (strain ATCC 200006 / CBS 805.95 / DAOM BR144) TaxID=431595 RepID=K3W763_GLOUD